MTDDYITDHPYTGEAKGGASCQYEYPTVGTYLEGVREVCGRQSMDHADPRGGAPASIDQFPHEFVKPPQGGDHCDYRVDLGGTQICGFPESEHHVRRRRIRTREVVRVADIAQYERPPMPEAARKRPVVTLIDGPVDPLGTLAVIGGIYTGQVARSKAEVTDEQRRAMLADMQQTVLNGPLECITFTFLVEGVSRSITHQMVRNRFSFFAQESLRFAVAEDWAQEVPLPPSLSSRRDDDPLVMMYRRSMNQAEDGYAALVGAGMPAEEARGVLPHDITTRLYWTVSLRTLLQEAGKRTCTQAQFPWRAIFGGVASALRARGAQADRDESNSDGWTYPSDGWQYKAFAELIRPVCYQQGKCGFMAKFDRGCTIRERVDGNEKLGRPSNEWDKPSYPRAHPGHKYDPRGRAIVDAINPREWATDPAAARVTEEKA